MTKPIVRPDLADYFSEKSTLEDIVKIIETCPKQLWDYLSDLDAYVDSLECIVRATEKSEQK